MKKHKHTGRRPFRILLPLVLAAFLLLFGPETVRESLQNFGNPSDISSTDTLRVHILDVGNGLSVLVTAGEESLLYDGGGRDTSSFVVAYLKEQGIQQLDYCIASHYDADHLYGVVGALHAFSAEALIAPDYKTDTKTYDSFCRAVKAVPMFSKTYRIDFPSSLIAVATSLSPAVYAFIRIVSNVLYRKCGFI